MGLIFNLKGIIKWILLNLLFTLLVWGVSFINRDNQIHHFILGSTFLSIFFFSILVSESYPRPFQNFLISNGFEIKPFKKEFVMNLLVLNMCFILFESFLTVNDFAYYFLLRSAIIVPTIVGLVYCLPMVIVFIGLVAYTLMTMSVGFAIWNLFFILACLGVLLIMARYAKKNEYSDYAIGQVKKSS